MKFLFSLLIMITFIFSLSIKSDIKQTTLLELFTSEGCNSCPPADEWVNTFLKNDKLFKEVIPVVFHVDYWDRLGWVDKFATNKYTKRQYSYSHAWKKSSVYTPGFILNGKEFKNWRSYKKGFQFLNKKVGVLKANITNNKIKINFNSIYNENRKILIEVSITGMNFISKVKAGENNGEIFNHSFVSVALDTYQNKIKDGSLQQTIPLPKFTKDNNRKYAITIWISDANTKEVIQSVASYLN